MNETVERQRWSRACAQWLRQAFRSEGWVERNGKDYCPKCNAKYAKTVKLALEVPPNPEALAPAAGDLFKSLKMLMQAEDAEEKDKAMIEAHLAIMKAEGRL